MNTHTHLYLHSLTYIGTYTYTNTYTHLCTYTPINTYTHTQPHTCTAEQRVATVPNCGFAKTLYKVTFYDYYGELNKLLTTTIHDLPCIYTQRKSGSV